MSDPSKIGTGYEAILTRSSLCGKDCHRLEAIYNIELVHDIHTHTYYIHGCIYIHTDKVDVEMVTIRLAIVDVLKIIVIGLYLQFTKRHNITSPLGV